MEIIKPLRSNKMNEVVSQWDADFVDNMDQDLLFEIIIATNSMKIPSLAELTCAKVASMIKGKTATEIRTTFNITEQFTPEEEAAIEAESWPEEV